MLKSLNSFFSLCEGSHNNNSDEEKKNEKKKTEQINTLFFTSINTQTKKTRKKSCLKREYIGYKQVRLIKYTFVTIKHLIVKNVGKRTPSEHKKKSVQNVHN